MVNIQELIPTFNNIKHIPKTRCTNEIARGIFLLLLLIEQAVSCCLFRSLPSSNYCCLSRSYGNTYINEPKELLSLHAHLLIVMYKILTSLFCLKREYDSHIIVTNSSKLILISNRIYRSLVKIILCIDVITACYSLSNLLPCQPYNLIWHSPATSHFPGCCSTKSRTAKDHRESTEA